LWVAGREMGLMEELESHKLSISGLSLSSLAIEGGKDEGHHGLFFRKQKLNLVLLIVTGSHGGLWVEKGLC